MYETTPEAHCGMALDGHRCGRGDSLCCFTKPAPDTETRHCGSGVLPVVRRAPNRVPLRAFALSIRTCDFRICSALWVVASYHLERSGSIPGPGGRRIRRLFRRGNCEQSVCICAPVVRP